MTGGAYFLVPVVPAPGAFVLDGDEGRHAATVRRVRPGERVTLTDGNGSRAEADVVAAARHSVTLRVAEATHDPPPPLRVTVIQALPKGERSERAVEVSTEAGVDQIVPWQSGRCIARWTGSADKAARGRAKWQRTAAEAAKQSRRSRVPMVHPLAGTDEVAGRIRGADASLVLHGAGSVPLPQANLPARGELVLVVGPEGGIAPEELQRLDDAGARTVRLGPHVLRTSTAAAVALGALGALTGRWH
jgi:16S rRNA (uracil1498-N3)-methyltransferase